MKHLFKWFWVTTGLALLIVVAANVAGSLHTLTTECAAAPSASLHRSAGGPAWAR